MSPKLGLLAGLVVAGFMAPATAEAATYTVIQGGWLHSAPDQYAPNVWQIPYGVRITADCAPYSAWCWVADYRGYRGYFLASYLKLYVPPPPPPPKYYAPPTYVPPYRGY
ncbi:MAG: SH3 domain-containing protein [Bauldia sp.]